MSVHSPTNRLLIAIATYIVALVVCWLVLGAEGFKDWREFLALVWAFPVGLVAVTHSANFLQWLLPVAPVTAAQVVYPAFAVAMTLTQHAKRFWTLYGV